MFQNRLMNHMWGKHIQQLRRDDDMRIKCLVAGSVLVNDLQREFFYGQEEIVSLNDYNKSKDLRNAISKNWLQVTDKYSSVASQQRKEVQKVPEQIIQQDTQQLIKKLAKEMAVEMVKEILEKMPSFTNTQNQVINNQSTESIVKASPKAIQAVQIEEETFVKMESKEDDGNITRVDLSKQAETKIVNDENIKSSLAMIKALRKKK